MGFLKTGLVYMATGTGKTVVMGSLCQRWPKSRGRILAIAHREELIFQAADKFNRLCSEPVGIEMGDSFVREWFRDKPRIVVASVQTLNALNAEKVPRFQKFDPAEFGLLLTDEAHRAPAKSYRRVYKHFEQNPNCCHLGVTATPDRTDKIALGSVFETVLFEYGILEAINDGWLVPIEQEFIQVDSLDLSECGADKRDLKDGAVAEVMEKEENLYAIADATRRIAAGRKTLIFTASVEHSHAVARILCGYEPGSAFAVDGKTDKDVRRSVLKRFKTGDFRYLVNCGVYTEGFDEPSIEVVSMARPTKSRALYTQILGRGTRPLDGTVDGLCDNIARQSAIAMSPKPRCTVLDFVGNSGRHKLVCSADILGGNEPDAVLERAKANAKTRGRATNMAAEIDQAKLELAEEKRLAASLKPSASFQRTSVDPFDRYDRVQDRDVGGTAVRHWLENQGVNKKWLASANQDQMQALKKQIRHRHAKGLATVKQVNRLRQYGIMAHELSKATATSLIEPIAQNQWRMPEHVRERAIQMGVFKK